MNASRPMIRRLFAVDVEQFTLQTTGKIKV
jgi:hypothetical protein